MVGTKEKLDRKGDIICNRGEDWWWDALAHADDPGIEIDWKWEARDKANDDLFYKFIDEHDYWEMFKESMMQYFSTPPHYESDDEVLAYLMTEGVVETAKEYDLHDHYMAFICDDEDLAEEYVAWLR